MRQLVFITLLSFFLPVVAQAAPTPAPAATTQITQPSEKSLKIGVVDVRTVLEKSIALQAANQKLEQKFTPREKNLEKEQADYKTAVDNYNKKIAAKTLSEPQRNQTEHALIESRSALQAHVTTLQQELDADKNTVMQQLLTQIQSIVNQVAKEGNYDVIFQAEHNVAYVKSEYDITNWVTQKLNSSK